MIDINPLIIIFVVLSGMAIVYLSNRDLWYARVSEPVPWGVPIIFGTIGFLVGMGFWTVDYYHDNIEAIDVKYELLKSKIEDHPELLAPAKRMLKDNIFTNGEWEEIIDIEKELDFQRKKAKTIDEIRNMTEEDLQKPTVWKLHQPAQVTIIDDQVWQNGRMIGKFTKKE